MAKSNYGRRVKGGKRKHKTATIPAAGVGQPELQTLQAIDTNQEADISSKIRQKLSVKQLQDKVRHTSTALETARNQIAALKDANTDLLERAQKQIANTDLLDRAQKQIATLTDANKDLLERAQHFEKGNSDLRVKIEKAESDKRLAEDRLANRIERFSLSRRKNTQAFAAMRKKNFQHRLSTTKEKNELVVKIREAKTEMKEIEHEKNTALNQCKELTNVNKKLKISFS